ncbi:MAG: cysteine desulfurase [Clostridia bacterium]|nr:cysteine desulfurase [Clostridia bacterium]
MEVYFDNSATTKPKKEVIDSVLEVMTNNYGNPSSLHRMGLNAEKTVKYARTVIAEKMCVDEKQVFFTSGGTESNNIAIFGSVYSLRKKGTVITSKVEHKSVTECFKKLEQQGYNVKYVDVTKEGIVDNEQLETLIDADTLLVSIMHVNNETGAIMPIEKIAQTIKDKNPNTLFHVDDVQGFLKVPVSYKNIDLVSVSAHKVNGLKGCGALYIKKGIKISPQILGGGQENGIRNGTENVPGIVGFGKAAEIYENNLDSTIKDYIIDFVTKEIDGCVINSCENASKYILNLSILGFKSETLLHLMEQNGIYVSSGSACSSNKPQLSHVLLSMGLDKDTVESSIRLSFCNDNTIEEAKFFCECLKSAVLANKFVRRKYK